jgi:uncharacterized membrane protein YozB (DUF420 family)
MSDTTNLYQSPQSDINAVNPLAPAGKLTETMVFYLKGASPWLRFIGILAFISAGLTIATGLLFSIFGTLGNNIFAEAMSDQIDMSAVETTVSGLTILTGIFVIIAGVIGFFPARFIYNFGKRIKTFLQNNSERELELAFKNNKSLWKFIGILTIIYLAFLPVTLIISIIAIIS